jgi:hypothetical protein
MKKILHKIPNYDFLLYLGEPVSILPRVLYSDPSAYLQDIEFAEQASVFTCGVAQKNQKYFVHNSEEVVSILDSIAK